MKNADNLSMLQCWNMMSFFLTSTLFELKYCEYDSISKGTDQSCRACADDRVNFSICQECRSYTEGCPSLFEFAGVADLVPRIAQDFQVVGIADLAPKVIQTFSIAGVAGLALRVARDFF